MTKILLYIAILLLAYLMGCSNMALYLSKYKGVDLRAAGSKNLGASNAMVLMGWGPGVIVAVHDIGKALLAVVLARHFGQGLPFIAVTGSSWRWLLVAVLHEDTFSCCIAWAPGAQISAAAARGLSACGSQALEHRPGR